MLSLYQVEFLKLRKRTMTTILSAILAVLVVGMMLLLYVGLEALKMAPASAGAQTSPEQLAQMQETLLFPGAIPMVLGTLAFGVVFLLVILAAGSVGGEYSWGTVRTMVVNAPGRMRFLLAKLLAISTIGAIWIVGGLIMGVLATVCVTFLLGAQLDFSFVTGGYLWQVVLMLGATALSIFPYVLLGFWLTVLGRSILPGIAGGIGYYFVESIVVDLLRQGGGWLDAVARATPNFSVRSLQAAAFETTTRVGVNTGAAAPTNYLDWWQAVAILFAYSAFFIVFALVVFKRRDIASTR
jgi:ABC-2 type transport system permease protein